MPVTVHGQAEGRQSVAPPDARSRWRPARGAHPPRRPPFHQSRGGSAAAGYPPRGERPIARRSPAAPPGWRGRPARCEGDRPARLAFAAVRVASCRPIRGVGGAASPGWSGRSWAGVGIARRCAGQGRGVGRHGYRAAAAEHAEGAVPRARPRRKSGHHYVQRRAVRRRSHCRAARRRAR